MRTTVDIPEPLLRQAKARAALEGIKMMEVIAQALSIYLGAGNADPVKSALPENVGMESVGRFHLPVIRSSRRGRSRVTPQSLKNADGSEDQERHASVFGR